MFAETTEAQFDDVMAVHVKGPFFLTQKLLPLIAEFWLRVLTKVEARHAPGRLKQWLNLLRRNFPQAEALYRELRPQADPRLIEHTLAGHGVPLLRAAA